MNVRIAPGAAIPLRFAEGDRSDPIAFSGQRGGRQNLLLAGRVKVAVDLMTPRASNAGN
jgi:hypothetical protein